MQLKLVPSYSRPTESPPRPRTTRLVCAQLCNARHNNIMCMIVHDCSGVSVHEGVFLHVHSSTGAERPDYMYAHTNPYSQGLAEDFARKFAIFLYHSFSETYYRYNSQVFVEMIPLLGEIMIKIALQNLSSRSTPTPPPPPRFSCSFLFLAVHRFSILERGIVSVGHFSILG